MNDLEKIINQSSFCFFFLIVDNYLDINLYPRLQYFFPIYAYKCPKTEELKAKNIPYFCLEEQGIVLAEKNSGRLLESPQVTTFINQTSSRLGKKPAIIPFKPSAKIDLICNQNNWTLVANPSNINRRLEDKVKFYSLCQEQSIPMIPSAIDELTSSNFTKYQDRFGQKLIIQTHFGWAGNSTYLFSKFNEIPENIIGITVKFSPFLEGYSLLNNCCLTSHGLIQSPPALQYTGLTPYTQNPFTTVGRQWPSLAPTEVTSQIQSITQQFSDKILSPINYQGFFGLDFLVDAQNRVYLLECNPRLTASFSFYTSIELKNLITPLFYFHLTEFCDLKYTINLTLEQSRFDNPSIVGSEITARDTKGSILFKHNDFSQFSQTNNPVIINPQVHSLIESHLHEL